MPATPPKQPPETTDPWRAATWEGARTAALLEGARMSLVEKLQWLEEAGRVGEYLQARRAQRLRGAWKNEASKR